MLKSKIIKMCVGAVALSLFFSVSTSINANAATSVKIPVLMYHRIEANPNVSDTWQIGLNEFKQEMKYLKITDILHLPMISFITLLLKKLLCQLNQFF